MRSIPSSSGLRTGLGCAQNWVYQLSEGSTSVISKHDPHLRLIEEGSHMKQIQPDLFFRSKYIILLVALSMWIVTEYL